MADEATEPEASQPILSEKHEQLIAEGKLWPDGSYKVVCPMCGRELPQGETLPGDVAVASAETVATEAATG